MKITRALSLAALLCVPNGVQSQSAATSAANASNTDLASFVTETLQSMDSGLSLAGLSDATDVELSSFQRPGDGVATAQFQLRGVLFDVVRVSPVDGESALLVFHASRVRFVDLMPSAAGTPLEALGALDEVFLIYTARAASGTLSLPSGVESAQGSAVLKALADLAADGVTLQQGMNFFGVLPVSAAPPELTAIFHAAGVTASELPLRGTLGAGVFKQAFASVPAPAYRGIPKPAQAKVALQQLAQDLGDEFIPQVDISVGLSSLTRIGPFSVSGADFHLKGDSNGQLSFGLFTRSLSASTLKVTDAVVTYDADQKIAVCNGAVDTASLDRGFSFHGLRFSHASLASSFGPDGWKLEVEGQASLNGVDLAAAIEIDQTKQGGEQFRATLRPRDGRAFSLNDLVGGALSGSEAVAIKNVLVTQRVLTADLEFGASKTAGEVAAFHPQGQSTATLAFSLDKLLFSDLVPSAAGSPLDGVELDDLSLVLVPANAKLKPSDESVPAKIAANLKKVLADAAQHDPGKANYELGPGLNLLADLHLEKSAGLGGLMDAAGLTAKVLPIVGTVSLSTFKPGVAKADSLKGLDLGVGLPSLKLPDLPSTMTLSSPLFAVAEDAPAALTSAAKSLVQGALGAPYVTINADLVMQAGTSSHDFSALLTTGKDAKNKSVVELLGSAKDPKGLFTFKGLAVKTLDLSSVYDAGKWDFGLSGTADLHKAAVSFTMDVRKTATNTVEYVATLDGGAAGISAQDVAGHEVPGFDELTLTKVEVTGDHLVADLEFGVSKTAGEVAAFHPQGQSTATLAFSLDKLLFSDLVPSAAGSPLDGVELDDLSLVLVPANAKLKPSDESVPAKIAANLKKVLADAAQHDPGKANYELGPGLNLLADLHLEKSAGLGGLMDAAGLTAKVLPIVGTVSLSTFKPGVAKADSLKGLDLGVGLPSLKLPDLPSTMTLSSPLFAVAEDAPAALTSAAKSLVQGALGAPYVTINADLVMQAGTSSHDFSALLTTGKDAKNKSVVELLGSAKDPKGLFTFKGLAVKTLDLSSVYDAGKWDFGLSGTADLHKAAVSFTMDVRKTATNTVEYVATLDGGAAGISAQDVAGHEVPGFDELTLTKVEVTGDHLVADLEFGASKTAGEVAAFHPQGQSTATLAFSLDKLLFSDLVPSAAGSPLDGVELDDLSLVLVPANAKLKPSDESVPAKIAANLKKVLADAAQHDPGKANYELGPGLNLLADLHLEKSAGLGGLMDAAGLTAKVLPIVGTVSLSTFKPGVAKADSLKGLDLGVGLPSLKLPDLPSTMTLSSPLFAVAEDAPAALTSAAKSLVQGALGAPYVTINADLVMQAGTSSHDFSALLTTGKDAKNKSVVELLGSAKDPKGLFTFKGLAVKTLDLSSVYDAGKWDFGLSGTADLHKAAVSFTMDVRKTATNTVEYVATLDAGAAGISAQDVAGHEVPGFDELTLTKVEVTGDHLVADLEFGASKTAGEVAAFHPQGQSTATLAFSLDKLLFSDLVPSAAGSPLDGVELDDLSLVLVPANAKLKPSDESVPAKIAANLKKVLADAAQHDPGKANYELGPGLNLLADLHLEKSAGLGGLMDAAGLTAKVLPIVGTVSLSTFKPGVAKADSLKGLDLGVGLPSLKLPGLPSTMTLSSPLFAVAEDAPAALTSAAKSLVQGALGAPYVTINADLVMQAGTSSHDFSALLTTGKDAKNKSVVELLGSAKDPKGLFTFKGLAVKTLDLSSVYDAGKWDFGLSGTADLHKAAVSFTMDVRKTATNTVEYVATLDGGAAGISAQDVAGHEVPGFDELTLTKVEVTGDHLVADLEFGASKTAGEVAAFHPQGASTATLAFSLDKLLFSDLVPSAAGSPLDGVGIDKLTLVAVPQKAGDLAANDAAIPSEIAQAIGQILADSDLAKDHKLNPGISLLAELSVGTESPLKDLMDFIGLGDPKPIPLVGTMSLHMFDRKAKGEERFKGMNLGAPMPALKLAGLPSAFSLRAPRFQVSAAPPAGVPLPKSTGKSANKKQSVQPWVGVHTGLDANLMGSKIAFKSGIGFSGKAISMAASSSDQLAKPFGIAWLDLKDLALGLDFDRKSKAGDLSFSALPVHAFGKLSPRIQIELKEDGGKLAAGLLKITDKLAFSDLPILSKLPHADKFNFDSLEISKSGLSGASKLHDIKVDATAFEHEGKWSYAVSDDGGGKGFKFDRLIPALTKSPLKDFHLSSAALVFTEVQISGKVGDLPEVAQPVFRALYGSESALATFGKGITVAAGLSPGDSTGFAGKALNSIGLHDEVLIEGGVTNLFGSGPPGIDILVQTGQGPGGPHSASHAPKMAKFPTQVDFFVKYEKAELDLGLQADVTLNVPHNQTLQLDTDVGLDINDKGYSVELLMDLHGQWKNPFGVHGIELDDVTVKFSIGMEGDGTFGFGAKTILADGAEKIEIAAETDFNVESAGLPDGIAMKGSISDLGIPAIIDVAERLAGGKASIVTAKDLPLPEFKNVTFAFATPGISDPQLGLIGSGFMLRGTLWFLGRELGELDLDAGSTGIKIDANVDPIDFKIVKLEKNVLKLDMGFKSAPSLALDSEMEFLGATQQVHAAFDDGLMSISFEDKIGGGLWDSSIMLRMGVDTAHEDTPDIFVAGDIKADLFGWLQKQAPAKVREFFDGLDADLKVAEQSIANAQQVVDGWNSKIAARKAVVQREKADANAAIQRAESRVRSVQSNVDFDHGQAQYHQSKCHWYSAWECGQETYYWAKYGVEYAAYQVAEGVLRAAQSVVDHMPAELMDPQLDALVAEQTTAAAALAVARAAIDGVEDADKWMESGVTDLVKAVGSADALAIKDASFEADLAGMLNGEPAILSLDLEIFGDDLGRQTFAFKLDDPAFDLEQMIFIPLHMTAKAFQKYVPESLKKLTGPVLRKIDAAATASAQQAYQELKNVPGLKLPPELKGALEGSDDATAKLGGDEDSPDGASWRGVLLASNSFATVATDAGRVPIIVAQQSPTRATGSQSSATRAPASGQSMAAIKQSASVRAASPSFAGRLQAHQDSKKGLMLAIMNRNRTFGESLVAFENQQLADRTRKENDEFIAYTDIQVPPGELFTQRLLVARHAKLCLGQNAQNKITFHPCSDNPGGLLWATRQMLVDSGGKLIRYTEDAAAKWPQRVYTQLVHNGLCLTTPFHLAGYDRVSEQKHQAKLADIASRHPSNSAAQLTLAACRSDGKGQLWKVVKLTHDQDGKHGFKIQERDSSFCLRPDDVRAHTTKANKEVKGVFYPCTGIAHGTFELTPPNADMPIWYDHNGVIKSENGFCLNVPRGQSTIGASGSVVQLEACGDDADDRWDYVVEYDKTVKIINDYTGYCLYPYQKAEGAIPGAAEGQLVQRPCDGRYGQNWKLRIVPQQKWFQLEALDKNKRGTNTCMLAAARSPGAGQAQVHVKSCEPATGGRWEFGHWKGTYQWALWDTQNESTQGAEDLTKVFWVSADSLQSNNRNGICRVIDELPNATAQAVYAGTWNGVQCSYMAGNKVRKLDPSQPSGTSLSVEVLTGLDIGKPGSAASWMNSSSGVPVDSSGQNSVPPAPRFSAFLVGGTPTHQAMFLCRVKNAGNWRYGYQANGISCLTDAGMGVRANMQVLVFSTVSQTSGS